MNEDLIIPSKPCPVCRCRFTPKKAAQVTCARRRCRNRWASQQRKPLGAASLRAAIEAKKRKRDEEVRARLREQFGTLSDREVALFKFIYKTAYQRGYNTRMAWEKRRGLAVGAAA